MKLVAKYIFVVYHVLNTIFLVAYNLLFCLLSSGYKVPVVYNLLVVYNFHVCLQSPWLFTIFGTSSVSRNE